MADKKKVLMLASVASMIDQFNMPNIRLMQELGYEVHVACNFQQGNTCSKKKIQKLQMELRHQKVVWHQWDCPRNIVPIAKCYQAYWQLWNLTGAYAFVWIHCHSPVGGAIARLVAHKREIKVIYTAHGFHFYKGAPIKNWLLYYLAEKALAHWTDVLIVMNQEDYLIAKRKLRAEKIYYIPGVGIDIRQFQKQQEGKAYEGKAYEGKAYVKEGSRINICRKYQIPENAVLLLSVGELSKRKNHRAVLSALAKLSRRDVYYLICGQGVRKKKLIHDAKRLGVAEKVKMPGFQENIAEFYRAADIFVFPSLQEGMPVALMEAMAAGLPCVVSDIRGNRELIDDIGIHSDFMRKKNSMVRFKPGDREQLRKELEIMIGNERLRSRYGEYNKQKIMRYDLSVVQKKMKVIYRSLE